MESRGDKCITLKYRRIEEDSDCFSLADREVPKGEFELILEVLCFSVDPIMNVWMSGAQTYYPSLNVGDVMHCCGLGRVLGSKVQGI